MTTTTFRRPTRGQIDGLRKVAAGYTSSLSAAQRLIERGWVRNADGFPALTDAGQEVLSEAADMQAVEAINYLDRPAVRLQKRMNGRSWLGYEVICHAGCEGRYYNTRRCVWATNDHEAWDKYRADVAYARHVLQHVDDARD